MKSPWWEKGLYFACVRCGACCGHEPGTVCFTGAELSAMADSLGVPAEQFILLYTWKKYGVLSLREEQNYDCVFLLKNEPNPGCRIYSSRPAQCSTFPFWPEILESRRSWEKYASSCPGMDSGTFHSYDEIYRITVKYAAETVANFL